MLYGDKEAYREKTVVCFIGTPCQVYGLKSFLGKEYDNLVTVDVVCHGTPSPKMWEKYLNLQKSKYHSEIESVAFRYKTYGYHSSTMRIAFKNGKSYFGSARVDLMLKSFLRDYRQGQAVISVILRHWSGVVTLLSMIAGMQRNWLIT